MGVEVFHSLSFDVLGEMIVDFISGLRVDLTLDGAISHSIYENTVAVLCLRVEHYARDRVVLAFDGDHKLFVLVFIDCKDVEEVIKHFAL